MRPPVWEKNETLFERHLPIRLLLKILHDGSIFRDAHGWILSFVFEFDLVSHAAIVFVPGNIRDFISRSIGLDCFLHAFGQSAEFCSDRAGRGQGAFDFVGDAVRFADATAAQDATISGNDQ